MSSSRRNGRSHSSELASRSSWTTFVRTFQQSSLSERVLNGRYNGSGTETDPFIVEFLHHDPGDPMDFSAAKKWFITASVTMSVFVVTMISSAYSASTIELEAEFGTSKELIALGISLYVLGFALGPALWAPLSELYGRRAPFIFTYAVLTACTAGCAGSNSMVTLLVLRLLGGIFGASPLTNAGGNIADLFPASERGLGMAIFATAPFLGPVLGPIAGGYISENIGWRWLQGILSIFTGIIWIFGVCFIPETYGPVLLQRRAIALSKETGKVYISVLEEGKSKATVGQKFKTALARPWVLLFREPIVLFASSYMAILYGTVYMLLGAFAIIFHEERGWSEGAGGLAFLGLAFGIVIGLLFLILDNRRYKQLQLTRYNGNCPPETRLLPGIIGAIALPVGLFWFSWTNSRSIHWIVCIIASAPFGFGMILVFLSCMNYLIDAYTIYAASVLAAGAMLRAFFGAAFPLFTRQLYAAAGIHWASSIPGFLTLICLPFPILMYFYGTKIRAKCKYAAEAANVMAKLQERQDDDTEEK